MLGTKDFSQPIFISASLHDIVPEDHFLRQVDKLIDFSFIKEKVKHLYSHTGQPSIDPVVLVKILLIGYFYNIASERKLVTEIQVNLAYRLFIGYNLNEEVPEHSTISKGRYRFGEEIFEEIFDHIVKQCIELGLVEGEHLSFDSTLVKANASLSSLEKVRPKLMPADFLDELEKQNPNREEASSTKKKKVAKNDELVSSTDSDASLIKRSGKGTFLAYKAHVAVDSKSRIITSCLATASKVADNAPLIDMLNRQLFRLKFKPKEVSADKIYGTYSNLIDLSSLGIEAYIPLSDTFTKLERDSFSFDSRRNCPICPQGKALRLHQNNSFKKRLIFKANRADCNSCPKKCTTSKNGRTFELSYHQPLVEKARERMTSPKGKEASRIRKTTVEPIFNEAKNFHGLSRAKFRGNKNMQIQLFLTTTAINIKRMLKLAPKKTTTAINKVEVIATNIFNASIKLSKYKFIYS